MKVHWEPDWSSLLNLQGDNSENASSIPSKSTLYSSGCFMFGIQASSTASHSFCNPGTLPSLIRLTSNPSSKDSSSPNSLPSVARLESSAREAHYELLIVSCTAINTLEGASSRAGMWVSPGRPRRSTSSCMLVSQRF